MKIRETRQSLPGSSLCRDQSSTAAVTFSLSVRKTKRFPKSLRYEVSIVRSKGGYKSLVPIPEMPSGFHRAALPIQR